MKSFVFIHMAVEHILADAAQEKIVLGNYAMCMNEMLAPEDGEHDHKNMFSEI